MSELVAYHEAGHALLAVLLGGRVDLVTIEPDDDDGPARQGDTQVRWRRSKLSDQDFARQMVQVSLAGPVAEMIYSGDPYHPGMVAEWAADWRDAWQAAELLHSDERQRLDYLERVSIALYRQLSQDDFWAAVSGIADHLLAYDSMEHPEVREIVREWIR